jgi:hypothetical protein
MGYRSQVVMAVSPRVLGDLLTALSANKKAFQLFQLGLEEGRKNYEEDGDVLLVWPYIKWYVGYGDVDVFDDFLHRMDEEEKHDEYRFVRVGEEPDDIMTAGCYACDIYPSTSIVY